MSQIINITVTDNVAVNDRPKEAVYVCGNSDYVVRFSFDAEWDAFDTKTARFKYNGTYQDIVFTGNECAVPVIEDTYKIEVGVFAGNLHATTPAVLISQKSILCGSGSPAAPNADAYAQIMEKLNSMGDVSAAVQAYMAEHPVATPDLARNDETAPDYVKNRTHWVETGEQVVLYDGDVTLDTTQFTGPISTANPDVYISLEVGETYSIQWGEDAPREVVAYEFTSGKRALDFTASDGKKYRLSDNDYGSDYTIEAVDHYTTGTYHIALSKIADIVHTLDPKYLPTDYIRTLILDIVAAL